MVNWSHSWLRPVENAFEKFNSNTKGSNKSESDSNGTQIITKFTSVSVPEHTSFDCINLCIDEAYIHGCND